LVIIKQSCQQKQEHNIVPPKVAVTFDEFSATEAEEAAIFPNYPLLLLLLYVASS
jgi:hypothetical protein